MKAHIDKLLPADSDPTEGYMPEGYALVSESDLTKLAIPRVIDPSAEWFTPHEAAMLWAGCDLIEGMDAPWVRLHPASWQIFCTLVERIEDGKIPVRNEYADDETRSVVGIKIHRDELIKLAQEFRENPAFLRPYLNTGAEQGLREGDHTSPPGKQPNTAMGKLAIKAAWEIEQESKRRATAKEVIALLQKWADGKKHTETLRAADKRNKSVEWVTGKAIPKSYGQEACGKTLEIWHKSRI
jgi:hypothetical protein